MSVMRAFLAFTTMTAVLLSLPFSADGFDLKEVEARFREATELEGQRRYAEAGAIYKRITEVTPKKYVAHAESLFRLAYCLSRQKQYADAVGLCETILKTYPGEPGQAGRALYFKGLLYRAQSDLEAAKSAFRDTVARYPKNVEHLLKAQAGLTEILLTEHRATL